MSDDRSTSRNGRVFWTAAVVVVVLDVITKWLAEQYLEPFRPTPVIGNVARLTLVYNRGAAFSMSLGNYSRLIFGAFAVIAIVILWRLFRQTAAGETARVLALGLAWGGAAGNLIDRVRSGRGVVDFIDIGVGNIRFWTFNVADSAVTVGALLLAWVLWQEDRRSSRRQARGAAKEKATRELEERTGT